MATTEEIMNAARQLGELIATHEVSRRFEQSVQKLEGDADAQRAMADYQRFLQKLGEKETGGKPIEVEEKRQLEKLQGAVIRSPTLQQFQVAQMDYLDLMRRVDEAMAGHPTPGTPGIPASGGGQAQGAPPATPIFNPEVANVMRPKS